MAHDRSPDRPTAGMAGRADGDVERGVAGPHGPGAAAGGAAAVLGTVRGGPILTGHADPDAFTVASAWSPVAEGDRVALNHAIAYAQPFTVAISRAGTLGQPHDRRGGGDTRTAADARALTIAHSDSDSDSDSDSAA